MALPGAVLIGFAFACVGCAASTVMRSWPDVEMVNFVMLPLFLFSATFYPITVYPEPLRTVAELSPLTRSADLLRSLTTGTIGPSIAIDMHARQVVRDCPLRHSELYRTVIGAGQPLPFSLPDAVVVVTNSIAHRRLCPHSIPVLHRLVSGLPHDGVRIRHQREEIRSVILRNRGGRCRCKR
jgi:hypothetical protein